MSSQPKRRKKVVRDNPNPLFEKWITEWKDEALNKGWKTHYTYSKALNSLRRYPLPLKTGKEAKILEFFGDKICHMLDEKLAGHRLEHGLCESTDDETSHHTQPSSSQTSAAASQSSARKSKKATKTPRIPNPTSSKVYIPLPRTGPFALLVTLFLAEEQEDKHFMKKNDLQEAAQPLCDNSFTVPVAGSHYTAWSSMSTLILKGLVLKVGNPARYSLSSSGKELASRLAFADSNTPPIDDYSNSIPSTSTSSRSTTVPESSMKSTQSSKFDSDVINLDEDNDERTERFSPQFTLKPGEFSVVLCVDNCETQGGSKGSSKTNIIPELQKNGVPFEIRKLHVGDFLWIAKQHVTPIPGQLRTPEPIELVLDHVIERKRLDDLAQSIKDGRYKEQKFRLKRSGVRCPMYLIEGYGVSGYNVGLPEKTLKQAYSNTQINDGFIVKITKDQKESVAYLTIMTRHLQTLFSAKTLVSCTKDEIQHPGFCPANAFMTFKQFNTESMKRKNLTVRELFVLQLMKLRGLSKDKAIAISKLYQTPSSLFDAYKDCSTQYEKEKLLSLIKVPPTNRNLGPALSKTICQLYCLEKLL